MTLIGAALPILLSALTSAPPSPATQDSAAIVRRVAATATLAAQEYRIGVVDGRVVAAAEVEEARLFLEESRRSAATLAADSALDPVATLDSLLALVKGLGEPDSLDARVRSFATVLARRHGVSLDELPSRPPDLALGGEVYRASCAGCHGDLGRGDGRLAAGLNPPPANLADWGALGDQSPLDYYRRINIGVVGTAMPAFEDRLAARERWAVALYASTLRLPPASGEAPATLQDFTRTGRMSDAELLDSLGAPRDGSRGGLARLAAVRAHQSPGSPAGDVLATVRAQVDSVYALARTGDPGASTRALDAYMTFEQVERELRGRDAALAAELETDFAALRAATTAGPGPELDAARERVATGLDRAAAAMGVGLSTTNLFVQSFVIMLREGLEAILIVGALMTFLAKMGASDRRRHVHAGILAAIVASLLTALALETVFHFSAAHQEVLEGATMVVATVVLFYVSYWLLSKMEVVKWTQFVKSKVHDAVTHGSALALGMAAFLAVYREGFETVLFYKALLISAGPASAAAPVLAGMLAGSVILVGVYLAMSRFGVRLPLKPFFAVTSAFLYYMALVFAGAGIAELQEGGFVSLTPVAGIPRVPAIGLHPTVETVTAQAVLVALALVALLWTFVIEPRRALAAERRRSEEAVA
ncbi:MAG TPA: FTR1 family protein [Gemmatimonadales bacterium]|nr:FTR1 family protein [Gemmatimonadales bacterium]